MFKNQYHPRNFSHPAIATACQISFSISAKSQILHHAVSAAKKEKGKDLLNSELLSGISFKKFSTMIDLNSIDTF